MLGPTRGPASAGEAASAPRKAVCSSRKLVSAVVLLKRTFQAGRSGASWAKSLFIIICVMC